VVGGIVQTVAVVSEQALQEELVRLLQQGLSRSEASRQLAHSTGQPRRLIYRLALGITP
jgi:16S rRNA (cytidine1402-2'-O)-methyltransferase